MKTAITPLDQITADEESRAGGKAYNCARLRQAGFRVPDGLAVLSNATAGDLTALANHPWFDRLPTDARFAVRSSGIGEDSDGQSFAGIHQTVLDVGRAELRQAVAMCWASARSEQALEYRRARKLSTDAIQMGVLIQCMIQPLAAGVAFTANPVTGAGNEVVINSSWGVGEALVSGQVDPDEFVVRKKDGELMWSRIGDKGTPDSSSMPSLSPGQVQELARILTRIEEHYGAPQDVEWCHDGNEFWIVQSRPITTHRHAPLEIEWTRANLVEVLPDITSPQALSAVENALNRAERRYMGKLVAPEPSLGPMLKAFYGRLYFNLSQLRHVCALSGVAPAETLRSMGHAEAIQPDDEKPARPDMRAVLSAAPDFARILSQHLRAQKIIREHEARTRKSLRGLAADPRVLSDSEVWAVIEEWYDDAPDYMQTVLLLSGVLFHEAPVRKICARVGFPFEHLVYPQLAAGERSVSAQQAFDLMALSSIARSEPAVVRYLCDDSSDLTDVRAALHGTVFLAHFQHFLQVYGHRGHHESDWSLPRYSEEPAPLLRAIRAHLEAGSERGAAEIARRQEQESTEAWTAFERRLSRWQKWTMLPRVRKSVRRIKQYYVWREQVRSDMVRVLSRVRTWSLVLADRFAQRGWLDHRDDYFLIHLEEIAAVIKRDRTPKSLRQLVAQRLAETLQHRSIQMPLLMRESELPALIRTAGVSSRFSDERQLSGHPVSGGSVEAEVVVVRDPGDFGRMKPGAILVASATDPSWTPLFTLASGVIVEVGGVLSHASTVAREYGLPALANVKHATRLLKTGERVRLDAVRGIIHRLDQTPAVVETADLLSV